MDRPAPRALSGPTAENRRYPLTHPSYLLMGPLVERIREAVRERVKGDALRVLDLGCGGKPYAYLFQGRARRYTGVDTDLPSAADVRGEGEHLPFRGGSFDVTLCTQVLEHVRGPERLVSEVHRVLADGGTLILTTHGVWVKHGRTDYWRWTDDGLKAALASFSKVEILNCGGSARTIFQMLNMLALYLPFGRTPLYVLNNVLGQALDRLVPNDLLVVNYVAVATK